MAGVADQNHAILAPLRQGVAFNQRPFANLWTGIKNDPRVRMEADKSGPQLTEVSARRPVTRS